MPKLNPDDTIAALSTPPGEGGIAVIRVSGKDALSVCERFFRASLNGKLTQVASHTIHHGEFLDELGEMIDEVLVSIFRAPHSYTGEEVVEISCHGGIRITQRILETLLRHGARPAEPGEFTKRAFLHGKMDLTQAEAVLDLIRARSDSALEVAVQQLQGNLSKKISHLKESLMKIYAHFEASLDFPDERLEVYSRETFLKELARIEEELSTLIASFKRGEILREGILTVIVGRPNVGKSSLLNTLLEKDRALVSAIPGTTRDALEETLEIGRMAIRLVDTAGLGLGSRSELDQMGMERTRRYLKEGRLFLFLIEGSSEWTREDEMILSELEGKDFLLVINKTDLPQKLQFELLAQRLLDHNKPCFISCLNQTGIPELEKRMEGKIRQIAGVQESATLTRLRHRQALEKARGALQQGGKNFEKELSTEFILEDLKGAIESLQELIGEVYSEDLLDVIFQEFCIGK